jgi:prepilin-type processing-associated H-X9-DG protein
MAALWVGPSEARYLDQNMANVDAGAFQINSISPGTKQNAYSIGSRHEGGANMAMADGSVRFINDSIDPATWKSLGGINDGHTASNY